jgi:hypothetical protein
MSLVPPATRDGWSYSGDFHVEASGNNRHRRATVPELKAVYDGTDGAKDPPAHWYEAQLIHYGLPPSKTKGTAKMRLFDAVNKGNLAVPAHIKKTETELKKEWTKRERDVKQALKKLTTPATTPTRGSKRKADDGQVGMAPGTNVNINISMSIGPDGSIQMAPPGPAPKKAKSTPTAKKPAPTKSAPTAKKPAPTKSTPTAKKPAPTKSTPAAKKPVPTKPTTGPSTQAAPRTKQTARRGTSSAKVSKAASSRPAPAGSSDKPAPQFDATPSQWEDSLDDHPPPYLGSPMYPASSSYYDAYDDDDDDDYYYY